MVTMRPALLTALAAAAVVLSPPVAAQDAGPGTGGAVAALRAAKVLSSPPRRVLMIGAHPDDEDTDLIALLSRGDGVETAYLSLTRGEGGQNLIGNELGAALGLLRTEELLAARRIDGGRQFFTRAFDFGFSKNAKETFRFWPRRELLSDVVQVIRSFRPHVIVSVWSGTSRDGHGHHQVAGLLAREAFDVAGDSTSFPEHRVDPWQTAKFYRGRYALLPETPRMTLDAGRLEPASGLSMHQLAARSRSRHRSQDMGSLEEPGPWPIALALEAVAPGVIAGPADSLFAGVRPEPRRGRDDQLVHAADVANAGVVVDAFSDQAEVAAGDSTRVTFTAWNAGADSIHASMAPAMASGWTYRNSTCDSTFAVAPGAIKRCTVFAINRGGLPDQPYYLVEELDGAMYQWPASNGRVGRPFDVPPAADFLIRLPTGGTRSVTTEISARSLDQAVGEVRRPLVRVPRIALDLQPSRTVWRRGEKSRVFRIHVEHLASDTTDAVVHLDVGPHWTVSPPQRVRFTRRNERVTVAFAVTAPAAVTDGVVEFYSRGVVGADTMRVGIHRIDYPHIPRRVYFTYANAQVVVAPVSFAARSRTGYVRGAADAIPEALANSGMKLRVLDDATLESAVLDSLDVLVIGPRAYEVSDAVRRAHPRIMAWVNAGGTLIVQYQQYQYIRGGFAPRPFTISSPHDRVTDESAPVTMLDPAHRVFRYPNVITPDDFHGWRQERGLYFAGTWDAAWTPLLSMADPGEDAKRGGIIITSVGRGRAVYTGLAFFRQIPAAVPGAWRLFANLLALGEPRAP